MLHVVPGDPIYAAFGGENPLSEEQVQALRAKLGLDRPLHVRYFKWLWDVIMDWGLFDQIISIMNPNVIKNDILLLQNENNKNFKIIYGGSVNQFNIKDLKNQHIH